jgi:peroxiredoxin
LNAEILAISVDQTYAQHVFSASLGKLPYPLLSDWHKQTAKDYGIFDAKNEIAKRSVFVVDKQGNLTFINTSFDANKKDHYEQVFTELEKIK